MNHKSLELIRVISYLNYVQKQKSLIKAKKRTRILVKIFKVEFQEKKSYWLKNMKNFLVNKKVLQS
jgi:hypothetical protein